MGAADQGHPCRRKAVAWHWLPSLVRQSGAAVTETPGSARMHQRRNSGFHRTSKRKSPASFALIGLLKSAKFEDLR
jgi:hypothetical protein